MSKHRKDSIRLPVPKAKLDEITIGLARDSAISLTQSMVGNQAALFAVGITPPDAETICDEWPEDRRAQARMLLYAATKNVTERVSDWLHVSFLSGYRDRLRAMRLTKSIMAELCRKEPFSKVYELAKMNETPDVKGFERGRK